MSDRNEVQGAFNPRRASAARRGGASRVVNAVRRYTQPAARHATTAAQRRVGASASRRNEVKVRHDMAKPLNESHATTAAQRRVGASASGRNEVEVRNGEAT